MTAHRAAVYTRLSREREDQTSTRRQERDCRALATAKGWDVVEVYEDVDFSAFRPGVTRPAYERMLADALAGKLDAIVIWKVDRLARSLREFLRFTDACDAAGVAVVSCNEPFDTSSPIGRAITQVLAVFAELESATIGMRVRSARDWAADHGKPRAGGRRAYGWTREMEQVPEEARVVREIADRLLRGESASSVAHDLNAAGSRTTTGSEWTISTLLRTVRQPHHAGLRVHHGEVVGEGDWEPILRRAEHEALQSRERSGAKPRVAFLTRVLRCGHCGERLHTSRSKGRRVYRCPPGPGPGCGRTSIVAEPVEDFVRLAVLERLRSPEMASAVGSATDAGSQRETEILDGLAEVEERLTHLGEDYAAGLLPRAAFVAAAGELEARRDALHAELDSAGRPGLVPAGSDPAEEWEARDIEWRSQVVAALYERIDVLPGRGAPHERLRPVPLS